MGVQTAVNSYPASAVAGDRASQEKIITLPYNCTAESDVLIGGFVFSGSDEGLVASTGETVLGFAVRNLDNLIFDLTADSSQYVPTYHTVTVAVEGDFYATTTTDATVGQKVFASTTDGTISTADAGSAVDGAVETNFSVKTAGSADDLIIIGTWGVR